MTDLRVQQWLTILYGQFPENNAVNIILPTTYNERNIQVLDYAVCLALFPGPACREVSGYQMSDSESRCNNRVSE